MVPELSQVPARPSFVVEHQIANADGTGFVHQQIFDDGGLAAWVPDRAVRASDLVLVRAAEIDVGDLLGLASPAEVACATAVESEGKTSDVFGVGSVHRPDLDGRTAADVVDICMQASATPFGDVEVALRLNPDGTQQIVDASDADCQITICGDWGALVQWIHTDTLLGDFINDTQVDLQGSLMVVTYAEGCISWPKTTQDQQWSHRFHETISAYRSLRLDPAYIDLMDEIEETCRLDGGW